jgi:hypothetical protein
MAKLSARGRKELARITREQTFCAVHYTDMPAETLPDTMLPRYCQKRAGHEGEHAGNAAVFWERTTRAFMSDRKILKKQDCKFIVQPGTTPHSHTYGWTVEGKAKPDLTPQGWVECYTKGIHPLTGEPILSKRTGQPITVGSWQEVR